MKYIDAELLKAEIERHIKDTKDAKKRLTPNMGFFDAKLSGIYDVMAIIDSTQQEQQEADLEAEVRNYCNSSFRFDYDELNDSFISRAFEFYDVVELARHFAEWGAEHLCDSTKIIDKSLEEEIRRYLREECSSDDEPTTEETARHFAEWQYQKDRGEFAKLKAKEWSDGYAEGIAKGKEKIMKEAMEGEISLIDVGDDSYVKSLKVSKLREVMQNYNPCDKVKVVIIKDDGRQD